MTHRAAVKARERTVDLVQQVAICVRIRRFGGVVQRADRGRFILEELRLPGPAEDIVAGGIEASAVLAALDSDEAARHQIDVWPAKLGWAERQRAIRSTDDSRARLRVGERRRQARGLRVRISQRRKQILDRVEDRSRGRVGDVRDGSRIRLHQEARETRSSAADAELRGPKLPSEPRDPCEKFRARAKVERSDATR